MGTERHEARRIDDQLRGRAGRQGDPGLSQFFLSLEDDLLRVFGGERIKSLMEMLKIPEDQPIESKLISNVIEDAQKRVEGFHSDARSHLLEYDNVMNRHREAFYRRRKEILEKEEKGQLRDYILGIVNQQGYKREDYEKKEKEIGFERMRKIEKLICLRILDSLWINHLESMGYLRDSVKLRAYGKRDPLVEYKNEGHKMFKKLFLMIDKAIVNTIFRIAIVPTSQMQDLRAREKKTESIRQKVGRNDPCPCGSGKKYKKCCYPKYG